MRFCTVGTGYGSLSLSALLSRKYRVTAVDIVEKNVAIINRGFSPTADREVSEARRSGRFDLELFISECDAIIANCIDSILEGFRSKVCARDLFLRD